MPRSPVGDLWKDASEDSGGGRTQPQAAEFSGHTDPEREFAPTDRRRLLRLLHAARL